ncbi:MAG: VOC family protein [Bacteroidales bacterium]|nr:VOC family protein [Bacteroidales bacterium]
MDNFLITGIQQVGVGTENFTESWKWYAEMFQMNIRVLEDDTVAELMLPYTGNQPHKRHACIAINMQGGGGFEIWQYSERKPIPVNFKIQVGDLGIFAAKVKCRDAQSFYEEITAKYDKVSAIEIAPDETKTFWIEDPWGNYFQIVEYKDVYRDMHRNSGGALGVMIGVTDIEKSLTVYRDILGYDQVIYDKTGVFNDWGFVEGSEETYRRVLLTHSRPRQGNFSEIFGKSYVELVVALDREPRKIFENRFWGDPGFIQLCMDVVNMRALEKFCTEKGYPFTVDSCPSGNVFDMGEASGHFTYIEDPDGTLIEFVETHRIPILKKLGWYLNLKKWDVVKPIPKWLLGCLRWRKVKFTD